MSKAREQVTAERAEELAKIKALSEQLNRDRKMLLKMPEFQRVMTEILAEGGMFRTVMTGNSQTFYQAGKQDYSRLIWEKLARADKDLAFDLLKPIGESNE